MGQRTDPRALVALFARRLHQLSLPADLTVVGPTYARAAVEEIFRDHGLVLPYLDAKEDPALAAPLAFPDRAGLLAHAYGGKAKNAAPRRLLRYARTLAEYIALDIAARLAALAYPYLTRAERAFKIRERLTRMIEARAASRLRARAALAEEHLRPRMENALASLACDLVLAPNPEMFLPRVDQKPLLVLMPDALMAELGAAPLDPALPPLAERLAEALRGPEHAARFAVSSPAILQGPGWKTLRQEATGAGAAETSAVSVMPRPVFTAATSLPPDSPPRDAGRLTALSPDADILRSCFRQLAARYPDAAIHRNWALDYLSAFPFEDVPYLYCPVGRGRAGNVRHLAETVLRLIRRERINVKVFFAADDFQDEAFCAPWSPAPLLREAREHFDIFFVPWLPPDVHQTFLRNAAFAVTASLAGDEVLAMADDALACGTPVLCPPNATLDEAGLPPATFINPFDPAGSARHMAAVMADAMTGRAALLAAQTAAWQSFAARRTPDDARKDWLAFLGSGKSTPRDVSPAKIHENTMKKDD